jgi:hypothetical protein
MADVERTGSCIVCRRRDPMPELKPVCGPCRSRAALQLREIPLLCELLAAGPRAQVAYGGLTDVRERVVELGDPEAIEGLVLDAAAAATTARAGTHAARVLLVDAGPVKGLSSAPRVAGSREAPVPVRLDEVDLLGPARVPSLTHTYRGQLDDQVGTLSAATILDGWCRDWSETRREHTPEPVVARQCSWLADRLDWAFAEHPAVDEFTAELGDLWAVLRRACGLTMPRPEPVQGVPCRSVECDLKTLVRVPGSVYVECSSCGGLMTEDELQAWCKLLLAATRRKAS